MDDYFDPTGTRVAIPMKVGGVRVLDPATAQELFTLTSPRCADHFGVRWSDDGNLLATSGSKGSVCVFDVRTRWLVASWSVPLVAHHRHPRPPGAAPMKDPPDDDPGNVVLLAFTPDGKGLIAGEDEPMGPSSCGHGGLYRSTTAKPLGDLGIICGSGYSTTQKEWIVGWDGLTLITKDLRIVPLRASIVSPDGHHVLREQTFDTVESAERAPKLAHAEGATLISFDPTGTKILGTVDDVPHVWSAVSGELLGAFE